MSVNIKDLTLGQIEELRALFGGCAVQKTHRYMGKNVVFRTVTYHYIGRLVAIEDGKYILEEASWLACSNRWSETLQTGNVDEVEPYPGECMVHIGTIVDECLWDHPLPREAK